jgi:hypothetical protein
MVEAGLAQVLQRAERVETGKERHRQAVAARIEPERGWAGQDADRMGRPDRRPVGDALDIVPHPVAIDQPAAGGFGDAEHGPVDMGRHARQHVLRRLAKALRPVATDELVITANSAGGDDHALSLEPEAAGHAARTRLTAPDRTLLQYLAFDSVDDAAAPRQPGDAMAEPQLDQPLLLSLRDAAQEGLEHAGPRAPGDMEARHGIAVAGGEITAALGPADDREPAHTLLVQPAAFLASGEIEIAFSPCLGPVVLLPIETGRAEPVLPGESERIPDPQAALLGRIDQEESAEGPVRLTAQRGPRLLLDDDDLAAGIGQLGGGDEAGKACADDDHIRIERHASSPLRDSRSG